MSGMSAEATVAPAPLAPIWGELRYSAELARLLGDEVLRAPRRRAEAPPVFLIPGFMAGDSSLVVMRAWLRRRGHRVARSGMLANVDCAGRIVDRLQVQVRALAAESGRSVVLIGQSRGGALARALAVREPDSVAMLVTLGSPVLDPLAVSAPVLRTVRLLARLGDLRVPGLFSTSCHEGDCCAAFRDELTAPLDTGVAALAIHSRSDAIVDWRACLDPHGDRVEVDSSHCGMSVHPQVYRVLDRALG
ncbi:MAG TPA: alpha/beta fold hydrolase [Solirubrobacteraceae bacterium]|nr:alpha/beta fold hydrolase [Solirubrobacteraceae bacterium]